MSFARLACFNFVVTIVHCLNNDTVVWKDITENQGYNKYVRRPVLNLSEPVIVEIEITLYTIHSLEMKDQILTTSVGIKISWTDEFISWNGSLFGKTEKISAPLSEIWKPDVSLMNNAENKMLFENEDNLVNIYSNGLVEWYDFVKIRTYCFVNTEKYPFETENCKLNFSSKILDNKEQMLTISLQQHSFDQFASNGEWTIYKHENIKTYKYMRKSGVKEFASVVLEIKMYREQTYYLWRFVIPTIAISILDIVKFCLPATSNVKLTLSTFVVLSFTVMIQLFNESLPTSSNNISLFGVFLWFSLAISGIVVKANVFITAVFYRELSCFKCKDKSQSEEESAESKRDINSEGEQLLPGNYEVEKETTLEETTHVGTFGHDKEVTMTGKSTRKHITQPEFSAKAKDTDNRKSWKRFAPYEAARGTSTSQTKHLQKVSDKNISYHKSNLKSEETKESEMIMSKKNKDGDKDTEMTETRKEKDKVINTSETSKEAYEHKSVIKVSKNGDSEIEMIKTRKEGDKDNNINKKVSTISNKGDEDTKKSEPSKEGDKNTKMSEVSKEAKDLETKVSEFSKEEAKDLNKSKKGAQDMMNREKNKNKARKSKVTKEKADDTKLNEISKEGATDTNASNRNKEGDEDTNKSKTCTCYNIGAEDDNNTKKKKIGKEEAEDNKRRTEEAEENKRRKEEKRKHKAAKLDCFFFLFLTVFIYPFLYHLHDSDS